MNNVGDIKVFTSSISTPMGRAYTYVWRWWDGTVSVTTTTTVSKRLNMGGNPADGFLLRYEVVVVDEYGSSTTCPGSLVVNNPPTIVPPPSVSPNDRTFPYNTVLQVTAFDFESDAFGFFWYEKVPGGRVPLTVSNGLVSQATDTQSVTGYYSGTLVGSYTGTRCLMTYHGTSAKTLEVDVVDSNSGTSRLDFQVRGRLATNPFSSITAVSPNVQQEPDLIPKRIGTGQTVNFSVYSDVTPNPVDFTFSYYGSNGWTATGDSVGSANHQPNGAWRGTDTKSIANELPGEKKVIVWLHDTVTDYRSQAQVGVELLANAAPVSLSVAVSPGTTVSVNTKVTFTATATDPDGDLISYKWSLVPSMVLYGRRITVVAGATPGETIDGQVTATDRYGGSVAANLPTVITQ